MFVKSVILVGLNMLFAADFIRGSRTMSLNTLLQPYSGKSTEMLSSQREFLGRSRENFQAFRSSASNGVPYVGSRTNLHPKSPMTIGIQNGLRMHYDYNQNISHLYDNKAIHGNGNEEAAKRKDRDYRRHQRTIAVTAAVPAKLFLTAPEIIRRYDYPVEEHFSVTPDGYILGLHRIPGPRHSPTGNSPQSGRAVLLMHGLFGTSTSFLINGPQYSLGFLLADAGYDVWLGNCRGNTYSRNHTYLNPDKQIRFWQFSQDEIASQDVPTMVNYILEQTAAPSLFYVGYSQGTRLFYMTASVENTIVHKVKLFIAMASTGSRRSTGPRKILAEVLSKLWNFFEAMGVGELQRRGAFKSSILYWLCNLDSSLNRVCSNLLFGYFGRFIPTKPLISQAMVPYVLNTILGGASMRQFAHYNQLSRGKLQKFDFGFFGNKQVYGSAEPPVYDVSSVTCPTAVYWGNNDPITPEQDILRLAAVLPNLVSNYKVPHPDFNHIDFIYSGRAKDLVYDHVISLMSQY